MDLDSLQPGAAARDEEGAGGPPGEHPIPLGRIPGEHALGRGVKRHQAQLAKLRAADGEHAGREIDIGDVELERLPIRGPVTANSPRSAWAVGPRRPWADGSCCAAASSRRTSASVYR